ncbi:MAG TPA: anti-sigma factor antagonist [Acidobacteriaceae bacterium]|nr:anti-sigma factor antagonist [Acidobacteriaceae bacterium]
MPLTLTTRFCENVYVIHCTGRIVLGEEVKTLESALGQSVRECDQIVLNLGEVTRLDSIGLGLVVRYVTNLRKRGGDLRLAAPPAFVIRLLELTMLSEVIQTYATEQEAISSFSKKTPTQNSRGCPGPRVLVVDSSSDLCVFIRSVLAQHGYDVKSTNLVRDAKTMLQVGDIDVVLIGPTTPQLSSENVAQSLAAVAPNVKMLQLGPDFKSHHAHEAAQILLDMFELPGSTRQSA